MKKPSKRRMQYAHYIASIAMEKERRRSKRKAQPVNLVDEDESDESVLLKFLQEVHLKQNDGYYYQVKLKPDEELLYPEIETLHELLGINEERCFDLLQSCSLLGKDRNNNYFAKRNRWNEHFRNELHPGSGLIIRATRKNAIVIGLGQQNLLSIEDQVDEKKKPPRRSFIVKLREELRNNTLMQKYFKKSSTLAFQKLPITCDSDLTSIVKQSIIMTQQKRALVDSMASGNNIGRSCSSSKNNKSSNTSKCPKKSASSAVCDRYWEEQLMESIGNASKEEIAALAKDLFQELWKNLDETSAKNATASFRKKIQADKEQNSLISGNWSFKEGSLFIGENLKTVSLNHDKLFDSCDLYLASNVTPNTLVYEGGTASYGCCEADFDVKVTVHYDPDSDELNCKFDVSPPGRLSYTSRYGEGGGSHSFIATRHNNKN